jgi:hypothetical protein
MERGRNSAIVLAVLAAVAVAAAVVPSGSGRTGRGVQFSYDADHYTCYQVDQVGPTTKVPVLLQTQFDPQPVSALTVRTLTLCAPTSKNGGQVADPDDHLDCRQIAVPGSFRARDVLVTNQFGSIVLRVFQPWSLCAPALKNFTGMRFPPPPQIRPDHFECYTARYEGNFPRITVDISNQFEPFRTVEVRKPVQLCAPVEKTIGNAIAGFQTFPVSHPDVHLVCYELTPRLEPVGPFRVFTNPQFGVHQLVVKQRDTHCLPSEKILLR